MQTIVYFIGVQLYGLVIRIFSLFSPKANLWVSGRKDWQKHLPDTEGKKTLWFHCASLGEFEQGRLLIEAYKKRFPDEFVVLTFFSPSGYENQKNYIYADWVGYLPLDCPLNAKKFIQHFKFHKAVFVKYEFWYFYLKALHQSNVDTYLVSAFFRPKQHFFSWWGAWFRKPLFWYSHIFVQTENSKQLLQSIGVNTASVSGDTRFDRVCQIAEGAEILPILKAFKGEKQLVIAGSAWQNETAFVKRYFAQSKPDWKLFIAPHEIKESEIHALCSFFGKRALRYSQANYDNLAQADVLIGDGYGYLSRAYQYGDIALIGGGFNTGIHSTIEAAVFGMPILFGPDYKDFQEAFDMIDLGSAFVVNTYADFHQKLDELIQHPELLNKCKTISKNYVQQKRGATERILEGMEL